MNVVFLYALLAVGACFWHANCYEIDEETKMIFREACENANLEVQRAGALQQPVVKEIQRPTPSPAWSHSTALYFALPYMLFDPLNQFSSFFKNGVIQLLCPLCLRDEFKQNSPILYNGRTEILSESNHVYCMMLVIQSCL